MILPMSHPVRTFLCFGDSNTWGFDPSSITEPYPRRHPMEVRWTGRLATALGPTCRIIEEGQNGRTTVHRDPFNPGRSGMDYLPACLESHKPIDLVIMMLGSNDLKAVFNVPAAEVSSGAAVLARFILNSTAGPDNRPPKLLLVCPPPIGDLSHLPDLAARISNGDTRSRELPRHFKALASLLGCSYLNSQEIVQPSLIDGIHLEPSEHRKLAEALETRIREMGLV